MKVRIEIDTRTFVRFWLVVIGFAFGILALYSARTALIIIGTALFLALALNGPVSKLARRMPDRSRTLSTAIAFTFVVALLAAVIFLVVPPIVQQTVKFIESAPALVKTVSEQWHGLGNLIDKYHIQPQVDQAVAAIQADTSHWASNAGRNVISGVGSVFALFAATILVLVLTFLMLVEGPTWLSRLWNIYTDADRMKSHQRLVRRMHAVVSGYVTGQLTVSGIGSVSAGVTVFILHLFFSDVPANLALPTIAIAFTFSLIPMFGATIAGVIISLLLLFNSIPAGIIFAVYFMIYQQVENNFISPTIQSKRIELSPLAVLVAVTIGLYVFGVAGGIISIPIAGCLKVLVEDYLDRNRRVRVENEKPLTKLVKKISGESA
jgi:predicted PurR-regulated permease PerM